MVCYEAMDDNLLHVLMARDKLITDHFVNWRLHWTLYEGWNFNSGNYLFTTDTK